MHPTVLRAQPRTQPLSRITGSAFLAGFALFAGGATLLVGDPGVAAAANPVTFSAHVLVNRQSGLCLDPLSYDGASGRNVMLYRCDGHVDQTLSLSAAGALMSLKKGLCVDASGATGVAGSNVQLGACDAGSDQKWTLRARDGAYELVNSAQGLCADPVGDAAKERDDVRLAACNGKPDQLWTLAATAGLSPDKEVGFLSNEQARYVRLKGSNVSSTPKVIPATLPRFLPDGTFTDQPETWSEATPPGWFFAFFSAEAVGAGRYAFKNKSNGRYLAVAGGQLTSIAAKPPASSTSLDHVFSLQQVGSDLFALQSASSQRFVRINAQGNLALSPAGAAATSVDQFRVVDAPPPRPAPKVAADADPACVAAVTCVLDGSLRKTLEPMCDRACDDSGGTLGQLVTALNDEDMVGLCSGGVKAALDVTEMALTGFVKTLGEEALKQAFCDRGGGNPVCNGDPACNLKMAGNVCNPRDKAEEWANKLCSVTSYERDAGVFATCASDEEQIGALCYDKCPSNLRDSTSDAVFCRGPCPSGYTDTGLLCSRPISIIAKESSCPSGYKDIGLLCSRPADSYSKSWTASCRSGYRNDGLFCTRDVSTRSKTWESCPRGYTDLGATCSIGGDTIAKPSQARPVGTNVHVCSGDDDLSGLLCYDKCMTGYQGVANRCWK